MQCAYYRYIHTHKVESHVLTQSHTDTRGISHVVHAGVVDGHVEGVAVVFELQPLGRGMRAIGSQRRTL